MKLKIIFVLTFFVCVVSHNTVILGNPRNESLRKIHRRIEKKRDILNDLIGSKLATKNFLDVKAEKTEIDGILDDWFGTGAELRQERREAFENHDKQITAVFMAILDDADLLKKLEGEDPDINDLLDGLRAARISHHDIAYKELALELTQKVVVRGGEIYRRMLKNIAERNGTNSFEDAYDEAENLKSIFCKSPGSDECVRAKEVSEMLKPEIRR